MAFLSRVQHAGGEKPAATTRSDFLSKVTLPSSNPKAAKITQLRQEEDVAKKRAAETNSLSGILKQTAANVGSVVKNIAVDTTRIAARAGVNLAIAAVGTVDNERAKRMERDGIDLPIYGNTKGLGFTGKGSIADLKDILGGGLEAASAAIPAARAPSLLRSTLRAGAIEGTRVGAVSGAQFGAGRELQNPESTPLTVISEAAKNALIGAGIGLPTGAAVGAFAKARPGSFSSRVTLPQTATERPVGASVRGDTTVPDLSPSPAGSAPLPRKSYAPATSDGPTRNSGLSASVEAQAIERKLTDGFSDLPQYQRVSMADQAQKASTLIDADIERAKRIALGTEAAPADTLPESIFVALEERALKNGDVDLLRDLATRSTLSSEATAMGQRIRALGERGADSPVAAIVDLQNARKARFEQRTGRKTAKATAEVAEEIRASVRKTAPTKQTWGQFIDEISCNY